MSTYLRISGINEESIVDGPGIRFVVFAQGCRHNCPGCHNPQTHTMSGGTLISTDEIIAQMRKNPLLDGLTLSGGDPFEQASEFSVLAAMARAEGYNVSTYTGYTYEQIINNAFSRPGWSELLENTHLLIDGPFINQFHDPLLVFRGSSNQRLIDVALSQSIGSPYTLAV